MQAEVRQTLSMRLVAIRYAAHEINLYEFEGVDNPRLPPVSAGAHIDLHLPNTIVRSYSLIEPHENPSRYIIGVKRDPASRGGSSYIHDQMRVGQVLRVGVPRNSFPLNEQARHSVLIAGGIGITPILAMARRLAALGKPFELHYACREERDVALREEIEALGGADVHVDATRGCVLDLAAIVQNAPRGSHFYCCGPAPMLKAYEEATADIPPKRIHFERFGSAEPIAFEGGYSVLLEDTGEEYVIPEGKSILEVLRDAGHDMAYSCEAGICGSCQMRVIEGIPNHQDMVLSEAERAENDTMMICCSGAKSKRLVLAFVG